MGRAMFNQAVLVKVLAVAVRTGKCVTIWHWTVGERETIGFGYVTSDRLVKVKGRKLICVIKPKLLNSLGKNWGHNIHLKKKKV